MAPVPEAFDWAEVRTILVAARVGKTPGHARKAQLQSVDLDTDRRQVFEQLKWVTGNRRRLGQQRIRGFLEPAEYGSPSPHH